MPSSWKGCAVGNGSFGSTRAIPAFTGRSTNKWHFWIGKGWPTRWCPECPRFFAAAAELQCELTLPEVSQTVIITRAAGKTPVPDRESLDRLAAHGATLVIYLSVQRIHDVVQTLRGAYEPNTPVVVAYRVGWPDQRFLRGTLEDIAEQVRKADIRRHALIMVGDVFQEVRPAVRSRLYDGSFAHGFRSARS